MRHKKTFFCISAALTALISLASCSENKGEFSYLYENLPFDMPYVQRPSIPDYSVCLTDFGAKGDDADAKIEALKKQFC